MAKKAVKGKTKRRVRRNIPEGKAFIQSTFNNTIVTITDPSGSVISWGSSGKSGFKGSRKGTPYAAQMSSQGAARQAINSGREAAIRSLQGAGLVVTSIRDVTPIPHDGCRPRGRRRV